MNSAKLLPTRTLISIAATMAALIVGFLAGKNTGNVDNLIAAATGDKYLMLLYEDETFTGTDEAILVTEYTRWGAGMDESGQIIESGPLDMDRQYVGNLSRKKSVTAIVDGYYVFMAESPSAALEIAQSHPHIKYNGGIELSRAFN